MADIESLRIDLQQPFHPENKVGLRCLNDQMKMIAHQAVGMQLPLRLLARLAQGGEKPLPILVILENILSAIPTIHHVNSED